MPDITRDEAIALGVCAEGGVIAGIAKWGEVCPPLARRGLLAAHPMRGNMHDQHDRFDYTITEAGRDALLAYENAEAREIIDLNNRAVAGGPVIQGEVVNDSPETQ